MDLKSILSVSPEKAAPLLLGATITVGDTGGIIVEVEAYLPSNDAAAHNVRGNKNATASLFSPAGTIYVHTMRHHSLVDIVTQDEDHPGSLLLRAIEPTHGIDLMMERRGITDIHKLCNGPAKLCQALGITKAHNGLNVFNADSPIRITAPKKQLEKKDILISKRIGITKNADALLRFSIKNSPFVS